MKSKTKEQAGAELLVAINAYVDAILTERDKEMRNKREERYRKYIDEHKNSIITIPADARGPYPQALREKMEP